MSDYLRSVGTSSGGGWPLPIIVHGGARGADHLADAIARGWGWTPRCRRLPCVHPRRLGRGASHTAALAKAVGIPTRRYRVHSGEVNNVMPGPRVSGKSG